MPVKSQVNSSVTHDIAKIDNYSVYRHLGNKFTYKSIRASTSTVFSEPLLLAYTKLQAQTKIYGPLVPLDTSAWAFKGGFCACALSTKINFSTVIPALGGLSRINKTKKS